MRLDKVVRACEIQSRGGNSMQETMAEIMRPCWPRLVAAMQQNC